MALIKCKECGKEISGTAESCPHCGYRTAHGRSVTEAKTLLVQWVICAALIVVGLVLVFGNVGSLLELISEWEDVKHWTYSSFMDYLAYVDQKAVLWKVVFGIAFLAGGIIDMMVIKTKADSIEGNGFDAEQQELACVNAGEEQRFWKCASCGQLNWERVASCQSCGVTKTWSEAHKKE